MSLSWGKNQRFKFVSGGELNSWTPPLVPAVFAITYKKEPKLKPTSHTVLYFGQAENLSDTVPSVSAQIDELWTVIAGNVDKLYVYFHPMPGSTQSQRLNIQWKLISEYAPAGNY